jgi:hypothetical protein
MHTIIRTTIAQYYVNQAVKRGVARQQAQPGSVTFIQRFGGALNLHVHFHGVFLEDVYLDRAEAGLKPRFVKGEPPSAADIAEVCSCGPGDVAQTISRRVIRKLRHLGYLEAGSDAAGSTGYDPLMVDEPALAHTLATSVTQRMALGERAGQQVRLMGSGFGYAGERSARTGSRCASASTGSVGTLDAVHGARRCGAGTSGRRCPWGLVYTFTKPWSDGTTGLTLSPLELLEKLAALVPLPCVQLVRYGGCLAPHSRRRGAIV